MNGLCGRLWMKHLAGFVLLAALVTGCATNRVDWAARVGHYTYDQSVLDLGPPDKYAKLTDGTIVSEWLTHHASGGYSYNSFGFGYPYYYGPYYPSFVESYSPSYFLRLTFGPDGELRAWKRFSK